MTKRVGFIQSRGIGDLIIALPIALYYREQLGYEEVYWPICEEFLPGMQKMAPWIHWIPLKTDPQGSFFYWHAYNYLKYRELDDIVCLYQFLSNMPQLSDPDLFPILKFDQYKYAAAGVPFRWKQQLSRCITRDPAAEERVYKSVVQQDQYIVVHLEGSDRRIPLDFSDAERAGFQVIEIQEGLTDNVGDWLKVLEGAASLYLIDSCFANLVDGLDLHRDKWFIRRSKMDLTPVLLSDWSYFPISQYLKA
jgi:hypothetical protein